MKITVEGVPQVLAGLKRHAPKAKRVVVTTGYTQHYALVVHEDLEAKHLVGQAKYLEQPLRQRAHELYDIVARAVAAGREFADALLLAGLALQGFSQPLVPVATGALRASAFTRRSEES